MVIPSLTKSTGKPLSEADHLYGLHYDELWTFVAAGFVARLAVIEAKAG